MRLLELLLVETAITRQEFVYRGFHEEFITHILPVRERTINEFSVTHLLGWPLLSSSIVSAPVLSFFGLGTVSSAHLPSGSFFDSTKSRASLNLLSLQTPKSIISFRPCNVSYPTLGWKENLNQSPRMISLVVCDLKSRWASMNSTPFLTALLTVAFAC